MGSTGYVPSRPITYNQFHERLRQQQTVSLDQMSLRDYRERLQRKMNPTSFLNAMLEPLKTPAMRKKLWEGMPRKHQFDYLESLHKFNPSGAPETKEVRINKEMLKYARKTHANKRED